MISRALLFSSQLKSSLSYIASVNSKKGNQRGGKRGRSGDENQNKKMAVKPVQIPHDLLPPTVPKEACLHRIDFTKTDPPLIEYKDHFAAVIDNLFTEDECNALI